MRNDFDWSEARWIIDNAMRRVVEQDEDLITLYANERAVTHRLAVYLEAAFWGWHVDCEYNRQHAGVIPKTIPIDGEDRNVAPDVIVHQRGPWDAGRRNNLLAVEVKPWWAAADEVKRDLKKLLGYLSDHHYQFAAFVSYERERTYAVHRVTEEDRLSPPVPSPPSRRRRETPYSNVNSSVTS